MCVTRDIIDAMLRSLKGLGHLLIAIFSVLWYRFPSRRLTVIGVTGTDGKTTTATLIYEILKAAGRKTSIITSVHAVIADKEYDTGFHVTTPSAWCVQKYLREAVNHGDTHMVLEVTSHGLGQYRVWGIPFAVGMITNVTHEHLDWHGNFENYLMTKLSLLFNAKVAVVNRDERDLYRRAKKFLSDGRIVTYGLGKTAKVNPRIYPFKTKLIGEFNKSNILAALAVTVEALGVNKTTALASIASFRGVPGRMEIVVNKPFQVIIDFAHTPNGLAQALPSAKKLTARRLIHVFGAAGLRDNLKRPKMGEISSRYADIIVLTEEDYRTEDAEKILDQIASGIHSGKTFYRYHNRQEAINFAIGLAKPGDTVILTGKAHEKSLCRGKIECPWDEYEAVKKAFRERKSS